MADRSKSLIHMQGQLDEVYESLGPVSADDFEEAIRSRDVKQWQALLDCNIPLIQDFLYRTPKQRLAKLLPKHKEYWVEIHVLALLAIKRAIVLLKTVQYFPHGSYHRDLTAEALKVDLELREEWERLSL